MWYYHYPFHLATGAFKGVLLNLPDDTYYLILSSPQILSVKALRLGNPSKRVLSIIPRISKNSAKIKSTKVISPQV
mgnify:CR=1 FL=1